MNHSIDFAVATTARIALPTCKGLLLIYREDIIRIQSISNYSKLYLANGKSVVASKVLRWFEERVELSGFIRIHRTHLVNPGYIDRCGVQSSAFLFLSNGEKLKIARRKKAAVVHHLIQTNSGVVRKYSSHLEQLKHQVA